MEAEAGGSGGTSGDDVELLTELLVTALGVPPDPRDRECAAGRMTVQLLVALARSGAREVVAAALGLGLGEDVGYEVRRFAGDGTVVSVVGPMDAVDAVITAAGLVAASNEAINVVARGSADTTRCVLARGAGGPLVHRSTAGAPWPTAFEVSTPPALEHLTAAVRDVLAETTVEVDLSGIDEAVRSAVAAAVERAGLDRAPEPQGERSDAAVAVPFIDADQIARTVIARLVEDRRAPRTYDLTDIIASLIPTPEDVATVVAEQLTGLGAVGVPAASDNAAAVASLAELHTQIAGIADGLRDTRAAHELLARQMTALAREVATTCATIVGFESRLIG